MKFISHSIAHRSNPAGYAIRQITNDNGMELICTPHRASILSIRMPDSRGRLEPLLHNYRKSINEYFAASSAIGELVGPISFPHLDEFVSIGKKRYQLPSADKMRRFRTMRWTEEARCGADGCTLIYRSAPAGREASGRTVGTEAAHSIEIKFTQQNQLFTRYTSIGRNQEPCSLAHNLIWVAGHERTVLQQHLLINAHYFNTNPLIAGLRSVTDSKQDYRASHKISATCDGFYKLHGGGIPNAEHGFDKAVDRLPPALMIGDPETRRYIQLYTNFPFLHIKICYTRKTEYGIQFTPCIPLDSVDIFARGRARHTFRSCYQFGTL